MTEISHFTRLFNNSYYTGIVDVSPICPALPPSSYRSVCASKITFSGFVCYFSFISWQEFSLWEKSNRLFTSPSIKTRALIFFLFFMHCPFFSVWLWKNKFFASIKWTIKTKSFCKSIGESFSDHGIQARCLFYKEIKCFSFQSGKHLEILRIIYFYAMKKYKRFLGVKRKRKTIFF